MTSKEYLKEYRKKNKEKISSQQKEYRKINKEKINTHYRSKYMELKATNPEIIEKKKQYAVEWQKKNPKSVKRSRAQFYKKNREKVIQENLDRYYEKKLTDKGKHDSN